MQWKRAQRGLIATLFTIQIIRKDHATSGGRNANARLNTRKIGTLSAGVFGFIRFTACRCSKRLRRDAQKRVPRSEEHTSELQSLRHLVCRLLLEKKK